MSKAVRQLRTVSLILIAVLVFTALFNVIYIGNIAGAQMSNVLAPSVENGSKGGLVKSDLNFDSLREQYLNQELLQKNIASYDGDRWVIVELSGDTLYDKFTKSTRYNDFGAYAASVEGQKAQANIKAEHTEFLNRLDRHNIDYQVKYTYTSIANAIAVKVNAQVFNSITEMNGVVDAYYVEYYDEPKVEAVTNNANVYTTGIYNTDGITEKGDGMVVAILDTGLDYTHDAFKTMPDEENLGLTKAKVEQLVNQRNELTADGKDKYSVYQYLMAEGTADELYYNDKVPFGYDYADDDNNIYPSYSSHGTHVAGIVAGQSNYVVNDKTGEKFKGVAPNAQLVICKVFTDNFDSDTLGGANTMSILAALNDCAVLGVDVINMSLGSSAGFTEERATDAQTRFQTAVYNKIEELGISLVVAASNDYSSGYGGAYGTNLASNPDSGTVGSPSTYSAALSVASINGRNADYIKANDSDSQVAFITNSSNEFGQQFDFVEMLYELAEKNRGTTIPRTESVRFKYVPVPNYGRSGDYNTTTRNLLSSHEGFDGVIALVKRGENTFAEKVQIAMDMGAQACVIYNNVAGTIRMSLGEIEDPIPACSISMDAGKVIADTKNLKHGNYGVFEVNSAYEAGPFMSDFSSWGPTPNLELKPEITAHGGEIVSAVAGGYDKLSGTSMAAPNMAGAIALLRENLKKKHQDLSAKELNTLVNQTLMSTATIARNENGNPYSPRKQGAGLADIASAIKTEGYITVFEGEGADRKEKDKTKIELYDDPQKTGEYTLDFVMHNIKDVDQTYNPTTYVMTESMSSDGRTVAEKAYMLNDNCTIKYYVGANENSLAEHSGNITVRANQTLAVRVVITLNSTAKSYIEDNFTNGMYVEGFVSMDNVAEGGVTIGVPYLAFYGDWTAAPLFDYDVYEIAEDDKDTGKEDYYKIKASAAATTIYGRYDRDQYYIPMGTYLYSQSEEDVKIYPERDKIAVSKFDDDSGRTIYEIYMIYAGLLRGAREMDIVITNDATGEIIYSETAYNVRKSYANGGSNVGGPIMLEIRPEDWELQNNSSYSVKVKGKLDYDGGEDPKRATFEFPFTVDYEAPEILDYRIRYMPYTENRVVKYRIFMDIDVRDNQYVQSILPVYKTTRPTGLPDDPETTEKNESEENVINLITEYPIAVSGQKGEMSTVSFEVTDIYEEHVKTGNLFIRIEDYAFNGENYQVVIGENEGKNAMSDPGYLELVQDERLKKGAERSDEYGKYYEYTLNLPPYTLYTFNALSATTADSADKTEFSLKSLSWEISKASVANANGNELFTGAGGRTTLTLTNTLSTQSKIGKRTYAVININIGGQGGGKPPVLESIQLKPAYNKSEYLTNLNPGGTSTPELELNPDQIVDLLWSWSPWYCAKPEVVWKSDNPTVAAVDENGRLTAYKRGTAYITVQAKNKESVKKTIKVSVGRDYRISSYTLYDWYGSGEVVIPSNLNIMYLSENCFKGRTDITKVVLPTSLTEIPENAFRGCTNLTEIVIPGQCTAIKNYAFERCTSLKTITLGMYVDSDHKFINGYYGTLSVGNYVFKNCTSLTTIQMYDGEYDKDDQKCPKLDKQDRLTTLSNGAFENCSKLSKIDLSNLRVVGTGVFKDCASLKDITISADTVLGKGMFENCTSLEAFTFKSNIVPSELFKGCTKLTDVTLANGNVCIAADAFIGSKLTTLKLSSKTVLSFEGNSPFKNCESFTAYELVGVNDDYSVEDGVLYNKDKTTLISVPSAKTSYTLPNGVTGIAGGALMGTKLTSLDVSAIQNIGSYAFADSTALQTVVLPSGLTEIPAGLFSGCTSLTSVTAADNFNAVEKIGDNAFNKCGALQTIACANVKEIGTGAFEESGLTALPGTAITKVGDYAFNKSKIVTVALPSLTYIGDGAFANNADLTTINVGAISHFGDGAFVNCTKVTSAIFADGTEKIGNLAFNCENLSTTAITVTLPDTVKEIGHFAFYNVAGLEDINLKNVKKVGEMAFACVDTTGESSKRKIPASKLKTVDLSNIEHIGAGAFAATALTSVNLAKAKIVASYAFNECYNLETVTFGALKRLGEYVFLGAKVTEITLPASFGAITTGDSEYNGRMYTYEWTMKDEKGNVEDEKSRQELALAPGAFSGMLALKEIKMADATNSAFFVEDGVLYSKIPNGYVLEQYPAAKEATSYNVKDGTAMIAAYAFQYASNLEAVELPYTVSTIGANAFYQAVKLKNYTFNSVEAPKLLTMQVYESDVTSDLSVLFFRRDLLGYTNFYANFYGHAIEADADLCKQWLPVLQEILENSGEFSTYQISMIMSQQPPRDFGLSMTVPRNQRGYDGVWKLFFSDIKYTQFDMPDNTSHKAMEAIDEVYGTLGSLDAIASMSYEQIQVDSLAGKSVIGELAQKAREAYNKVVLPEQIELMTGYYTMLMELESALRARKAALGHEVRIKELIMSNRPDKIRYTEGERFDPTGMKLKVVYEDGSEVPLDGGNYQIEPEIIGKDTKSVKITYRDANTGQEVSTVILLNVTPLPEDEQPEKTGLSGGAIAGIVIGVLAVIAAAVAVTLVIVLKKKKSVKKTDGDTDNTEAQDAFDSAEKSEDSELNSNDAPEKQETEEATENAQTAETDESDSNEAIEEAGKLESSEATELESNQDVVEKAGKLESSEATEDDDKAEFEDDSELNSNEVAESTADIQDESVTEDNDND